MRLPRLLHISLLTLLMHLYSSGLYAQDTLYYNAAWQICERPLAKFYRFGNVVIDISSWYYKGRVQDFYLSNTLQMDGNYSSIGEKNGKFYFFYPDGTLMANGAYQNNYRSGVWEYYYEKGGLQAKVRYTEEYNGFVVLDYIDKQGTVLTKDSTGTFSLQLSGGDGYPQYRVTGEFKKGKKTGTWDYYQENFEDFPARRELFKDDKFQKGFLFNGRGGLLTTYKEKNFIWSIVEFTKFRATETFQKDRISFHHANDNLDLQDYLISRKVPEFQLDTTDYFKSYFGVLNRLNNPGILKNFKDPEKIYSGEVIFTLGGSGIVKDIEIYGNLSEDEKTLMLFS